jgi:GNAT superfamily N-acetyltransferase
MNEEAFQKVLKVTEEFYGTNSDPDQISVTKESADKILSIHPNAISYTFNEKGEPVAWVVVIPTSIETMNRFLHKQISESELLNIATQERKFEALYACSVFVIPEYRRKGYASALTEETIKKISPTVRLPVYTWIYSEEGKKLAESLSTKEHAEWVDRDK